jgi:hypothetical protein
MRSTGQVEIGWTDGGTDAYPNEHPIRLRKAGPARRVATFIGSLREVEIWWMGGGTDVQAAQPRER